MLSFTKQDALQKVNFTIFLKSEAGQIKPMQSLQCLHVFLRFCCWFCLRRWASISCLKKSMPSWPCEASFMALDCMHMRYWSGGSSSAQFFSCHRWNKPREGARTTNRLLWRYFLYRWTSSPPQPLMSMSKPPERAKEDRSCNVLCKRVCRQTYISARYISNFIHRWHADSELWACTVVCDHNQFVCC